MSHRAADYKLDRDQAVLVVIDVQERLVPAMKEKIARKVKNNIELLLEGAKALGIPVVTTEQYPRGLGHTVADLAEACGDTVIEKVSFGCCGEPKFNDALKATGRKQVLVTGMEAHVCGVRMRIVGRHPEIDRVDLVGKLGCKIEYRHLQRS